MAKKHDLGGAGRRGVGWESLLSPAEGAGEAVQEPVYKRKTYLIAPEMAQEIKAAARREGLPINEFVRILLRHALDEVQAGAVDLPGEVVMVPKRIIK